MTLNRKERKSVNRTRNAIGAVGLAALLTLTGCGSDDSDIGTDTATDTASVPTAGPGGFDKSQLKDIQACLKAAGLEDKLPTEQPTELPSDMPSDMPTDMPTDLPSDIPSGAPGGGFSALQDPEVQKALDACGIDLPQAPDPN
jgi:hypothetical protein